MRCSRCGAEITNEKIIGNYKSNDLNQKVWYCLSCLKEVTKYGPIHNLFTKVKESLSEEHSKQFKELDDSLKAAFILKCTEQEIIRGGTEGQVTTLRVVAASGI